MILEFMTYAMLVGLLLGLAALAMERTVAFRMWPRRVVWATFLFASAVLPYVTALMPYSGREVMTSLPIISSPDLTHSTIPHTPTATQAAVAEVSATNAAPTRQMHVRALPELDPILTYAWIGSSLSVLGFYLLGWVRLRRVVRDSPAARLDAVPVRIAESIGPAVVGYFRAQIVVPRWVMTASPELRAMILAHEHEHLAARDPLLLLGALLLIAVMPWNLPLWWQLRRLRLAIELDCDSRVLRKGAEAKAYGEMLFTVSQHRLRVPVGAMALGEPKSQLERRVRALLAGRQRTGKWVVLLGVMVAATFVTAAAQLTTPSLRSNTELRKLPPYDMRPGAAWAQEVARSRYPELFEHSFEGNAGVTIVFNYDGTVRHVQKQIFPPDSIPANFDAWSVAKALGSEDNDLLYGGAEDGPSTIGPWLASENPNRILISYVVLRWPPDPTRSEKRALAAVRNQYPEWFAGETAKDQRRIAVFLNDDGTVNRAESESMYPRYSTTMDFDAPDRFTALGIDPEQIGRTGVVVTGNIIGYAWRKRPDDVVVDRSVVRVQPRQDTADDRAIIEHYFPEALTTSNRRRGLPWMLLDRDGSIWATGHSIYRSSNHLEAEIKARFPGIKLGFFNPTPTDVAGPDGQNITLFCFWLAPDSPITDINDVDLSQGPDLVLGFGLDVSLKDSDSHVVPFSMDLIFGKSETWQLGNFQMQVVAMPSDKQRVELRIDIQSPSGSSAVTQAITKRVRYGDMAMVQVFDRDSDAWRTLELQPIHIKNAL